MKKIRNNRRKCKVNIFNKEEKKQCSTLETKKTQVHRLLDVQYIIKLNALLK